MLWHSETYGKCILQDWQKISPHNFLDSRAVTGIISRSSRPEAWNRCFPVNFAKFLRTPFPKAVVRRCSVKKVFSEISQNLQENTYARDSFDKVASLRPSARSLWHRCFPVNFAKFRRTPFLLNTSGGWFCFSCH